ncbi:penicillin-binding protein 1A [Helicobacter acinonychis]|uniref:Penicillin-binding protein n=2 Tax=Helicobacter acinonychis TaxID=212 RepID=Q17W35_HELAH|nr:transglycosylase domain-containing protein [Helicobacter acinonychis]CAK00141.1 penicillin-binding protein [Helicobacter acinonychis str. Sheeba]STP03475.1 pencillin binding protein [Helicobacter acinonychis]
MLKKIFYGLGVLVLIVMGLLAILIAQVWVNTDKDIAKIKDYRPSVASQILDRKGRLIANIYDKEFRFYARFEEIPPRFIESLLAVEDTLFFEHGGINLDAIMRAMIKNAQSGRYTEGGSTLTQQLVKNMVLTREKTLTRKLREAIISIRIEQVLSKEEILERYLNQTFFGHGYYGVKTASLGYFKKPLDKLTLKEIAMLVALPRAPSFYDPTKNLEFSLSRANDILRRLYSLGWISPSELKSALNEVPIVYNQTSTQNIAPYVVDEVLKQLDQLDGLKTQGYIIKLTIDLDYQRLALESLRFGHQRILEKIAKEGPKTDAPNESEDNLNASMVVTDTSTGKILALVGGIDYKKSAFNRATQAKRQFGSAIKPFVYQIAFDNGYSTTSKIPDTARNFENDNYSKNSKQNHAWHPSNYSRKFLGLVTLQEALSHSLNLATINLSDQLGFEKVYQSLSDMGFKNLPKDLSIVLGSFAISPIEAAEKYSLFSHYGVMLKPMLIESITNQQNEVKTFTPMETKKITSKEQAFLTLSALMNAVENGTGGLARVKGLEIAGKTGTSNNNVDAWFIGFTPTLQSVIWFGRDDNTPIGKRATGGIVSAPVYSYFMRNILAIEPSLKRKFDVPKNMRKEVVDKIPYYSTPNSITPTPKKTDGGEEPLLF